MEDRHGESSKKLLVTVRAGIIPIGQDRSGAYSTAQAQQQSSSFLEPQTISLSEVNMATKADLELEVQQLRRVVKSREFEIEELQSRLRRHRDMIRRVRLYLWSRLLIHRRTAETLEVGDSIAKTIATKRHKVANDVLGIIQHLNDYCDSYAEYDYNDGAEHGFKISSDIY
ncbi:hypothetical protein RVS57_006337 [Pseudomonas aeruginosa]|nr:hypothetical protein [Pseudomonas aeruginosa]